jgi:linoleoyl-CoA desaturase
MRAPVGAIAASRGARAPRSVRSCDEPVMDGAQAGVVNSTLRASSTTDLPIVRFTARSEFHDELKREVERYFARTGESERGDARMWFKTAVMLGWAVGSYLLLVFGDVAPWHRVVLAISLGLAIAGIGFSVMHDANHGSYGRNRRTNRVLGFTLDLIGGSSYMWRHKHNVLHHTYTNVAPLDVDLGGSALLRFSPEAPWRPTMRFQHIYVWALYTVYPLGWWFVDDFYRLVTGRIGENAVPRPGPADLAGLLVGKAVFVGWAVILPVVVHPTWLVIPLAAVTVAVLGLTLATTFQLAHCVGDAAFHDARAGVSVRDWATHQVTTTVDFARGNRLLGWYVGGLNFQIEHHLFPKVCHVHYRALSRIVEKTCAVHGVRYAAQPTLRAAVVSNVRWLRELGRGARPPVAVA